jgi:hypothetical protein
MVFMTADELLWTQLGDIMIRLSDFRAANATQTYYSLRQYASTLLQIDQDLEAWADALPSSWEPEVLTCDPGGQFYTSFYHKYQGFSIAAAWNQYRIARCLIGDLLSKYLDSSRSVKRNCDSAILRKQDSQVKETIQTLCNEISVSVPYFLGQLNRSDPPRPGAGALEVMWGLFVCARMRCIPKEQCLWATVQLEKIGHEMGVLQALSLADLVRSQHNHAESDTESDTGLLPMLT